MTGIQRDPTSYAFLRRDSERARLLAQQATIQQHLGRTLIDFQSTNDESTFTVTFPTIFVEEPFFLAGAVLDNNSPAVPNSFPIYSATVDDWVLDSFGPFNGYTGAKVLVVTSGYSAQRLWINYSFIGRALNFNAGMTPTSGTTTV